MERIKKIIGYFTRTEWALWISSMALIVLFFILSPVKDYFSLTSSLIYGGLCTDFVAQESLRQ